MSVDIKSGLAYGFYLTADQVKAVIDSCSDFEQDMLYDSWLIPLDGYAKYSDALFAVNLRVADPATAVVIHKESIESGLAVQMIESYHKYCDKFVTEKAEPQFYVYSKVY